MINSTRDLKIGSESATRILHIYRTYFPDPPGGMQEAIRQIALSTGAQGIKNTVFTLSPNPQPASIQRPEANVVRCRSWAAPASCDLGSISAFRTFASLMKEVDVLHYLFPWPFADVLHAAVRPDCPAVLTYVSDVIRQRLLGKAYAPLMWHTLNQMRVIIANAPSYIETSPVLSHRSIREKVRVIPFGIEESSYAKNCDDAVFERLGIQANEPFFLFLGVLRYYKGIQYLVRAAREVSANIVIAGSGPEGNILRRLVTECAASNVIFAGQVTDAEKVSLLQRCRALVLPSHLRSEAFGMVLIEAAMFSRPLISCEIGTGTSYINAHEETGFVVPPSLPSALAQAMDMLLTDDVLAERMGIAARNRYEKLFSGSAVGKAYANIFREVAAM